MAGTPAAADPLGVTRIGKYQLVRRLATGGMAEIFLARTESIEGFEKLVVLKRILPQHAESADFIDMFLAEARLAATLHHPNIVQVYDIGEEGGFYFFTMEYVQGEDLRKLVRGARKARKPIPIEHILHIVMGVAAGLHHAHEKVGLDGKPMGIVHRDVSPSNVLVTYEGDIKLVDFGIAKAATAQVATIAGTLKGKIPYMSPEQCRGEAVDRRSDIFSIGTLLWELTTGKRLFAGDNEFQVLNRVAKGDVPTPSSVRPDYPEALEQIVMKALQADRDQRYATAIEMQLDLEDFARDARLPVSSARMGRFMQGIFEEEIEARKADLQAVRELKLAPPPPPPPKAANDSGIVSRRSDDYTPSEMRPLPGDTQGFNVGGTNAGLDREDQPARRVWPAVVGGLAAVLLLGGGLAIYMQGQSGDEGSMVDAAVAPTDVDADADAPKDEPEGAPKDVVEQADDPVSTDDAPDEGEPVEVDVEAVDDDADDPGQAPAARPSASSSPTPRAKPSRPRRAKPRKKSRPESNNSDSKPTSALKRRYDPNAALPPGL